MNIAIFTHSYLPNIGGLEELIKNLSREFIKKPNKALIVAFATDRRLQKYEVIEGVPVYRFFVPFLILPNQGLRGIIDIFKFMCGLPLTLYRLKVLLKGNKIQIINVFFTGLNAFYAWMLSFICPIKFILTMQGFNVHVLPFLKGLQAFWVNLIFKAILTKAAFVTGCSEYMVHTALKIVPGIRPKSKAIENCINPEEFNLNGRPLISYPYILCLGRLHNPFKGFDLVLFAFKDIIGQGFDINLVIAGEGPDEIAYYKLAVLLGIKERVVFFGPANRKQAVNLLKNCEFFAMPSRVEPFGIVNLEAMACSKAIVASRTGGVPEIIEDGVSGLLVEPGNEKALGDGIKRLLVDQELRNKLGKNGRALIESGKFSSQDVALKYLDIYFQILKIPISKMI